MRVVFDANVFASGILGLALFKSTPGELLHRWFEGEFEVLTSGFLLAETQKALEKPHFTRRIAPSERQRLLAILERRSVRVTITDKLFDVASHPEDDLVLATALSGKADVLVTGD
jgi:uncharacterized protein